jgi:RimJ/RimL family protein N-acetyltransferase
LFADGNVTHHFAPGVLFRRVLPEERDRLFTHHVEPIGDWGLDLDGRVIATGGFAHHYNRPFRDIFMEVDAAFRRQGFGRFLVQEMKKACYQSGSVPSARCKPTNVASRKTLEAAGFIPCARLIYGDALIPKSKNES